MRIGGKTRQWLVIVYDCVPQHNAAGDCHENVSPIEKDNDNDNESNFIAMNYIDHIIGDVQASSSKRNELVFVYIHLHSGIVSTLFSRISMYDTKKQNHNALFKPNKAVSKFMTKGARSLGLWAPISVEMKQNIGRGAEEQEKCASAKYGLYCRYSANINTFVINSIMLILY